MWVPHSFVVPFFWAVTHVVWLLEFSMDPMCTPKRWHFLSAYWAPKRPKKNLRISLQTSTNKIKHLLEGGSNFSFHSLPSQLQTPNSPKTSKNLWLISLLEIPHHKNFNQDTSIESSQGLILLPKFKGLKKSIKSSTKIPFNLANNRASEWS